MDTYIWMCLCVEKENANSEVWGKKIEHFKKKVLAPIVCVCKCMYVSKIFCILTSQETCVILVLGFVHVL